MTERFVMDVSYPKMVEEIWSTIDAIKDLNGAPFDIHDSLQRLSLNIVFRLTYGIRFTREDMQTEGSRYHELMGIINSVVKIGGTNVMSNYIPILKLLNGDLRKRQRQIIAKRDAILLEIVQQHRAKKAGS